MRRILVSLLLCLAGIAQAQDNYTVIKVSGKVLSQRLNRLLVSGDKIQPKDALKFGSAGSYLILQSPKSSRKVIRGVPDDSPREFMMLLQSFVKPSEKSTATRGGIQDYVDKLIATLSYDTLLILGEGRLTIETTKLRLDPPSGIRAIYRVGNTITTKKISGPDYIILGPLSLFGSTLPDPLPRVSIQYYVNEAEDYSFAEGNHLGQFVPRYIDEIQLTQEINTLIGILHEGGVSPEDYSLEAEDYLRLAYGGVIHENLMQWLSKNKFIK